MKRVITDSYIACMSTVLGKNVKVPSSLPFSFYFSCDTNSGHDIRVKPIFNPEKMRVSKSGTLKLCDDWEYIPGSDDKNVSNKDIQDMKNFFRNNLVLFCAVWDDLLADSTLEEYLEGELGLDDIIKDLDFYSEWSENLNKISSITELEQFCKENHLVNLRDN